LLRQRLEKKKPGGPKQILISASCPLGFSDNG
jgi:hypothetical protein